MASDGFINGKAYTDWLKAKINDEMMKEAEPVIEQVVKDFEATLRKKLASLVIASADGMVGFSYDTMKNHVNVQIQLGGLPNIP